MASQVQRSGLGDLKRLLMQADGLFRWGGGVAVKIVTFLWQKHVCNKVLSSSFFLFKKYIDSTHTYMYIYIYTYICIYYIQYLFYS